MAKRRGKGEGSIFRRKDGRWQGAVTVGYTEEGKQKRKTVYGKTQAEVREKLEAIKHQLATGTFTDSQHTIQTYLKVWLKHKAREVKPRTAMLYQEQADRYINPRIGTIKLVKLTPLHIQTLVGELAEEIGTPTANKARTLLFNALRQAVRWELLPRNPCEAVAKLKETPREMTLWSPAETVAFLDAARAHRLYAAFYLTTFAGLRRGELLGLTWADLEGEVLRIRRSLTLLGGNIHISTPKTRRGARAVVLSPDVLTILDEHHRRQEAEAVFLDDTWQDEGLMFPSELGTPMHPRNFERAFKAIIKKAGVRCIRFHDLRHLHVSLLVSRGLDPRAIADRVGHANPSFTLDVYSHMFAGKRRDAAVGMSDLLGQRGVPN